MKLTAFCSVVGDKESGSFGLTVHKTLEEAINAFELENGSEGDKTAAAMGQSCMFASVYETPFEDQDAAEIGKWELAGTETGEGEEYWPLFCKMSFEKGSENGGQDALEITRPAIIELQCFELMFKGIVELLSSGELKSKGDTVRDAAGPWTVKEKTMAGSIAGESAEVELQISLPMIENNAAYV